MDIANASLLDEATAAAEAMVIAFGSAKGSKRTFIVDSGVLPQTLAVLHTRARGLGINVVHGDISELLQKDNIRSDLVGALFQYVSVDTLFHCPSDTVFSQILTAPSKTTPT